MASACALVLGPAVMRQDEGLLTALFDCVNTEVFHVRVLPPEFLGFLFVFRALVTPSAIVFNNCFHTSAYIDVRVNQGAKSTVSLSDRPPAHKHEVVCES